MLHDFLVSPSIGLRTERMYGRPFSKIEHTVLDTGLICCFRHLASESIQLTNKMSFSCPADSRIAGHVSYGVEVDGEANGVHPETRRCKGCLNSGMPRTDYCNITFSSIKNNHKWNYKFLTAGNQDNIIR